MLALIALIIGAVSAIGLPTTVARAVTCEVQRLELDSCTGASSSGSGPPAGLTGTAGAGRAGLEQALGSSSLIDACAGGAMVGGGTKFTVTGPITGPSGQTWKITTVWGVDPDGTVRLITATPAK